VLNLLCYAAVCLSGVAIVRRSRMPMRDPRSGRYGLALTASSATALLVWTPATQTLLTHLSGRPLLAAELGCALQSCAAINLALLRARIGHATPTPHREGFIALAGAAILAALAVLAALPADPARAAAFQLLWCAAVIAGYGYFGQHAIRPAIREPDRVLRASVRLSIINAIVRPAAVLYLAVDSVAAAAAGQPLVGLTTPVLITMMVATFTGAGLAAAATLADTAVGRRGRSAVRWLYAHWAYHQLKPLWDELVTAVPSVRLRSSLRGVHERLTRRMIEIRDAQAVVVQDSDPGLAAWIDTLVADGTLPARRAAAHLAAAQIRTGIRSRQARLLRDEPANPAVRTAPRTPPDLDEAPWLCQVSAALRDGRIDAMAPSAGPADGITVPRRTAAH
jgi:hypothetical protein